MSFACVKPIIPEQFCGVVDLLPWTRLVVYYQIQLQPIIPEQFYGVVDLLPWRQLVVYYQIQLQPLIACRQNLGQRKN